MFEDKIKFSYINLRALSMFFLFSNVKEGPGTFSLCCQQFIILFCIFTESLIFQLLSSKNLLIDENFAERGKFYFIKNIVSNIFYDIENIDRNIFHNISNYILLQFMIRGVVPPSTPNKSGKLWKELPINYVITKGGGRGE